MRRRDLPMLIGIASLGPLGAAAQQSVPVVGFLFIGDPERSAGWLDAWRKSMAESGFDEGRNLAVEHRWGRGDGTKLPDYATDLVARRVSVIVTTTEPGAVAAKQATTTIPIVFCYISDPVGKGLVKSFTHPGGNVTGIADPSEGAFESKRLQLLHEVIPGASRIGYLIVKRDAESRRGAMDAVVAAGKTLGIEVVLLMADGLEEIDAGFAAAKQRGIGAVLVQSPATFLYAQQKHILEGAARNGLPVASGNTDFAEHGGLMQYSTPPEEAPSLIANYVARILKGQKPAELPVQHPTKTRLVLNLKTARTLGLTFPPALLTTADLVIE